MLFGGKLSNSMYICVFPPNSVYTKVFQEKNVKTLFRLILDSVLGLSSSVTRTFSKPFISIFFIAVGQTLSCVNESKNKEISNETNVEFR